VNQYIMGTPDYLFGRPVEDGVLDSENPFVILGQLRCAAHELPLREEETDAFGPHAPLVLRVLADNRKLQHIGHAWYHAAPETPQHEVSLRDTSGANVTIEDVDTGAILGEVDVLDAPPLLHPEAIYIHRGDTYRVIRLDLEKNVASVRRENVDYYTQALGGTDIHHIDAPLREKPFGTGKAFWGEVTAYCGTWMFERIHFYQLDPISRHGLDLPTYALETMAFWLVPTEKLMNDVRQSGLDTHQGLRGIGYALRMLLPLFMTCDTRDLSHSVGSVNSPWNAIFVFERYPHGLGFTEKAYHLLHRIVPAVREHIGNCPCEDGCPCCVGKPLRQFTTWNVERGEANIPSKKAALMILDGLLGDGSSIEETESGTAVETPEGEAQRLERALRRRLERMGEPKVFHPITPNPVTEYPDPAPTQDLPKADSDRRAREKADFARQLRKKLAKNLEPGGLDPTKRKPPGPSRLHVKHSIKPPTYFPGKPDVAEDRASEPFPRKKEEVEIKASTEPSGEDLLKAPCGTGAPVGASFPTTPEPEKKRSEQEPIQAGDPLAARAAKLRKKKT
ncbi:DUF1998 domain-containing protein, partial [bacterium]|nr:DUF1998 domain-containing protein [bacterium]